MAAEKYYEKAQHVDEDNVKVFYDQWAATYDEEVADNNGYAQPERCGEALDRFVTDNSVRVLDMGCGTGLAGVVLRDLGYESIDGCDYSPEMLMKADKTKAYSHLFEIDLNDHPLSIEPGRYGAICAVGAIGGGHVRATVVNEVVRLLPSGGVFVIGLNEGWWAEGSLAELINEAEAGGIITVEQRERGAHIPSHDVMGWVIVGRKLGSWRPRE